MACLRPGLLPHSYKRAHDFSCRAHRLQPSRFYNPALTPAQSCSRSESFAMIFSTTFALALLLLTHVAHALPNAEYSTRSTGPTKHFATFDTIYDNPRRSLDETACSDGPNGLAKNYPTFGKLPEYPWIGTGPGITWNSPHCGGCWNVTNRKKGLYIYYIAIDYSSQTPYDFTMSRHAFETLNGGPKGPHTMEVYAEELLDRSYCGF